MGRERHKTLFADDMIVYKEKPEKSTKQLAELISELRLQNSKLIFF